MRPVGGGFVASYQQQLRDHEDLPHRQALPLVFNVHQVAEYDILRFGLVSLGSYCQIVLHLDHLIGQFELTVRRAIWIVACNPGIGPDLELPKILSVDTKLIGYDKRRQQYRKAVGYVRVAYLDEFIDELVNHLFDVGLQQLDVARREHLLHQLAVDCMLWRIGKGQHMLFRIATFSVAATHFIRHARLAVDDDRRPAGK